MKIISLDLTHGKSRLVCTGAAARAVGLAAVLSLMTGACATQAPLDRALQPDLGSAAGATRTEVEVGRRQKISRSGPLKRVGRMIGEGATLFRVLVHKPLVQPVESLKRVTGLVGTTAVGLIVPTPVPASSRAPIVPVFQGEPMDLDAWEGELDRITGRPATRGRMDLLIGGDAFFPALYSAFDNAEKSIRIRTYIFDNDDVAVATADRLKAASEKVTVKILLDGLGTVMAGNAASESQPADFRGPASIEGYLERDSDVRVRLQSNLLFTGDHTKSYIVDGKTAFVGGMNIGREYRHDWHDMMIRLTGTVVSEISRDFNGEWKRAGFFGELGALFSKGSGKTAAGSPDGYPLRTLRTQAGHSEILAAELAAIQNARQRIYIENSYLADDRILAALIDARSRGVDVRVILSKDNDNKILAASNLEVANRLLRNGVRVYFLPGMSHVKAAVFDGWMSAGSANFDNLSMALNKELNIATSHAPVVDRLVRDLFEVDFARAGELTAPIETNITHRFAEMIADRL